MDFFRKMFSQNEQSDEPRQNGNKPEEKVIETAEEKKERHLSLQIIYFTMFLISLGFSIILTGIWPYLDKLDPSAGKEFMGYIVAANPLGQMLFSPLFGWWGNKVKSIRMPLLTSMAVFCIGSAVYSSLDLIESNAKYWMFFSRFFVGVSSANIAVCRSYLSAATKLKERTHAVSMVSLAQVLGFVFGPALQALVTPLGDSGYILFGGYLHLNMYTASGWINVFLGILNFLAFLPFVFKDRRIAAKEQMILQGKQSEKETWKSIKPDYLTAAALIFSFFVLVFNFVLLETLATSLTMEQFAWSKEEALYYMGILMSVGAIVACATFVLIGPLCERFKEDNVLIWGGFFLMIAGLACFMPFGDELPKLKYNNESILPSNDLINNYTYSDVGCPVEQTWCESTPAISIIQFIFGYSFISLGYPIGVTLIQTIFSKILGPRPQGVWMGLMTGAGCMSRVLGPVCVGIIYTRFGPIWTFGITLLMMLFPIIWLCFLKQHLYVPDCDIKSTEMLEVKCEPNGEPKLIKANGVHVGELKEGESEQFIGSS